VRACVIHRERVHGVEGEDQGDRADNTGKDGAGVVEFEEQSVDAEQKEDVRDIRIAEYVEDPVLPTHLYFDDCSVRCVQRALLFVHGHGLAVDLFEQHLYGRSDQIDHGVLQGLGFGNREALANCFLGPADVAMPFLADAADECGGVVGRLFIHDRVFFSPFHAYRWAAPMLVPRAMAAIWAARAMNVPADAACAPEGRRTQPREAGPSGGR